MTPNTIRYRAVVRLTADLGSRWNYRVRVIDQHGRDRLGCTMTEAAADRMADDFERELLALPFVVLRTDSAHKESR